jgi:chromosome segregation ATPase
MASTATDAIDDQPEINHPAQHIPSLTVNLGIHLDTPQSRLQQIITRRELKLLQKERRKWLRERQALKDEIEMQKLLLDLSNEKVANHSALLTDARDRLQELAAYKAEAAQNRSILRDVKKRLKEIVANTPEAPSFGNGMHNDGSSMIEGDNACEF